MRTMAPAEQTAGNPSRVVRHRKKVAVSGDRRVEITVPSGDAPLVRAIAVALRSGGDDAERICRSLRPLVSAPKVRVGKELVAFLRASPLVEADWQFERDRSTGRDVDLGC